MPFTAEVNVVDGTITIHDPDSEDIDLAGGETATFEVEPWGEDELSMARADRALAGSWTRISEWADETGSGQYLTAQVEVAR